MEFADSHADVVDFMPKGIIFELPRIKIVNVAK